jgi:hypothetical protein
MFSMIQKECHEIGIAPSGLKRNKIIHFCIEQQVKHGNHPPQYMPMLDLGRKSLATQDSDKVYGLLGMMPRAIARAVRVDYSSPARDVFVAFAKAMIMAGKFLQTLQENLLPRLRIL